MERRRLGRGLDALLNNVANGDGASETGALEMARVPLERVDINPNQPRKVFDNEELASLSASIRNHGVLQPLVVRSVGDRYQLIAGERRLRAAQAAGLTDIPVRIVDFNDQQVLEAALVENIQRSDLNPLEKAQGFADYLARFQMTHEELGARLGLDRTTVTGMIRLLDLPPELQDWVRTGLLSAGHARSILGLPDSAMMVKTAKEVISGGLSVRATEEMVRQRRNAEPKDEDRQPRPQKSNHVQGIEDELRKKLSARVEIKLRGKDKGQIVLTFGTNDDFERLLEVLRK